MRYIALFAILSLLTSCFSRSSAMTSDNYAMVQVGTPVNELTTEVGKPYAIHTNKDGTQEYEYIERIRNGRELIVENHYFLLIQNGKVVGKRMAQEKPKAYNLIYDPDPNYDSYNSFPSSFP